MDYSGLYGLYMGHLWIQYMILWMEEILHRVIGGLSMFIPLCTDFQPSQVVQDFFHPPYVFIFLNLIVSIATRGTWGSPKNWHRERQKPLRHWRVVPPPCCSCPSLRPRRPRFQPEKTWCLAGKNVMWIMLKGTALQIKIYICMYKYIYIRVYVYMDINII
jgi:hypothetical protein